MRLYQFEAMSSGGSENWSRFAVGRCTRSGSDVGTARPRPVRGPCSIGWDGEATRYGCWTCRTGEGAFFRPSGLTLADLAEHRIWVCDCSSRSWNGSTTRICPISRRHCHAARCTYRMPTSPHTVTAAAVRPCPSRRAQHRSPGEVAWSPRLCGACRRCPRWHCRCRCAAGPQPWRCCWNRIWLVLPRCSSSRRYRSLKGRPR